MPSYQRLNGNTAGSVFENPFENTELDSFDHRVNEDHREASRNPLIASFEQQSDDNDSFDNDSFRSSSPHLDLVDNRLDGPGGAITHLDESHFVQGAQQGLGTTEGTSAASMTNGSATRELSVARRITNVVDRVTSNSPGRKLLHKFFPGYVSLSASSNYNGQVMGNGLQNDGVFSNMMAKPTTRQETTDDVPPTYEEAAADSTPPYWESTVFSPYGDGVFVDGLPVGNIINFVWNLMVSSAFQFVGFLLTYLLHTSHAAKEGSRAGLGITFMSYGYYMIPDDHFLVSFKSIGLKTAALTKFEPSDPNNFDIDSNHALEGSLDDFHSSLSDSNAGNLDSSTNSESGQYFDENSAPIFAYGLVALGVFIFIKSLLDYHRAKQMEKVILQSPSNTFEAEAEPAEQV